QPMPGFGMAGATPFQQVAFITNRPETVGSGHADPRQPRLGGNAAPSVPLPTSPGIYAGNNGEISALKALPISMPPGQFQLSAEITEPGRTLVVGDNLKFVVV